MKRFMILLAMLVLIACHRTMESWPSDGDRQEVAMYVRTRSLTGITATPSMYQLFVYDSQNQKTTKYNVNTTPGNQIHLKLFPGSYTGFCTTFAETDDYWEYSENHPPANIFLKGQKTKNGTEAANDHLLGQCEFIVSESNTNQATFDLSRKVGMLRINIENIPGWLNDLQVNVTNIPQKMNLSGKYSEEVYTVSQAITPADEQGNSVTDLLLFPPKDKSTLMLSSSSQNFITQNHEINILQVNQITEVKATFKNLTEAPQVDFTTNLVAWEDQINHENWEVDLPEGPCQGEGDGHNLVINSSFEEGFSDNCPVNWKFSSGGSDKKVIEISNPVYAGNKAIRLEGKTQMYQDITISGGQCYQLKMFVNASSAEAKWRYWITWLNGKTELTMGAIHPTGYQNQTNGYTDAFNNLILRAPANANGLRVEIRNYSDQNPEKGLYVDAVSVEAIR